MGLIDIGMCPSLHSDTDTISQTCGVYRQLFHFIMLKKTLINSGINLMERSLYNILPIRKLSNSTLQE